MIYINIIKSQFVNRSSTKRVMTNEKPFQPISTECNGCFVAPDLLSSHFCYERVQRTMKIREIFFNVKSSEITLCLVKVKKFSTRCE